jgi:hypothetical protein
LYNGLDAPKTSVSLSAATDADAILHAYCLQYDDPARPSFEIHEGLRLVYAHRRRSDKAD